MTKKEEEIENLIAMTLIAQGQAIGRKYVAIGQGMKALSPESTPFITLDGSDVYYCGNNNFELQEPEFKASKTTKWGSFYHPCLLFGIGSDDGGWNKVYIDTRIEGWYLLWVSTRLNTWSAGPIVWVTNVMAWTPKAKNDSINKAGYRMFWALALAMDHVEINEYFNNNYVNYIDEGGKWVYEWEYSTKSKQVFAAIRRTIYKDENEYLDLYNSSPDILKPFIASRKLYSSIID